ADLGGHLLIDRQELGCNYTRGDINAEPVSNGNSFYKRAEAHVGLHSWLPQFRGYATDDSGNDIPTRRFQGCATRDHAAAPGLLETLDGQSIDPENATASGYRKFNHGDCLGRGFMSMNYSPCIDPKLSGNAPLFTFPGATFQAASADPSGWLDCSTS